MSAPRDRIPPPIVPVAGAPDEAFDDTGFDELLAKIERERGFVCGAYKVRCLRRRILARVRARGAADFAAYAAVIDRDPVEYERLVDALTINVTKLYRNRPVFDAVARHVMPALAALRDEDVRLWSAGCASGEEAYTLALLCREHDAALGPGERALAPRVRIVGTDIDRDSLAAAAEGRYGDASFGDLPPGLRERYFVGPDHGEASRELKALVRFERRDLLVDPPPFADAHVITCRNVLIYFDRQRQDDLLRHFHAALAPGGFLVLGKVEMLLGQSRALFANVEARERVYRKR